MTHSIPAKMTGVQLIGHGGLEVLKYNTDIPVPEVTEDEVLIKVAAAGVNNTDINTRIGWYSKKVTTATDVGGEGGYSEVNDDDASWSGVPLSFPRIQGADCCGHIVAVGNNVDPSRIGERILVRSMMESQVDNTPYHCWTFGSEMDGGFAQYAKAPATETYAIDCRWTDEELASIPCAYSTAENMLHRAGVTSEHVVITGASGGVGSAAVQLAKRRGATVTAIASESKHGEMLNIGADNVVSREANLIETIGTNTADVVIDLVAGPSWPQLLEVLKRGGRYATAGAIAGPLVELDVRTLYLKDLTLIGCTYQEHIVFQNLVGYIERDEIRPLVHAIYPLSDIGIAQQAFLEKAYTGKIVLTPPNN